MGWWSEQSKRKELIIGDEPLDAAGVMLSSVLAAYQEDLGRKPTPKELARTVEFVLANRIDEIFDDMEDKEVGDVVIKIRKCPKKQTPAIGDYFAVPLSKDGYGYGRIEDIVMKSLLLVGFLSVRSEDLLGLSDVSSAPVLFECVCGDHGLVNQEWPVLGNVSPPYRHRDAPEKERAMDYQRRLGGAFGYLKAMEVLEERLGPKGRGGRRFPWSRQH